MLRRPTKPTAATGTDAALEEVLDHGRCLLENADARRDVDEEHDPQKPELWGLPGLMNSDVVAGDQCCVLRRGHPARWLPAVRRDTDSEDAEHHEDEVEDAHRDHRVGNRGFTRALEVGHKIAGERAADHRPAAEAHDGKPGSEARAVGEPFDQRRDRRDVAEPKADPANDSIAKIDKPELMAAGPERGDDEAKAKADGRVEHRAARPDSFKPRAEERSGETEHGDGDREDVTHFLQVPGRSVSARQSQKRVLEDGEGIGLANRKMDGKGGRWDQPAAVSGRGYGVVAVEKSQGHIFGNLGRFLNPEAIQQRCGLQQIMHLHARFTIHDSVRQWVTFVSEVRVAGASCIEYLRLLGLNNGGGCTWQRLK